MHPGKGADAFFYRDTTQSLVTDGITIKNFVQGNKD